MSDNVVYLIIYLLDLCIDGYKALRRRYSRSYNSKMRRLEEQERISMYNDLLPIEMFRLGYEENTYLREHDTSIYESRIKQGDYFRACDDGSFSSKALGSEDLAEIERSALVVKEFISAWYNGFYIQSEYLYGSRIIAKFDKFVLTARCIGRLGVVFSLWEYQDTYFINGKKLGTDYAKAKEAFAAYILMSNCVQYDADEKLVNALKNYNDEDYEADSITHEIKAIIPVKKYCSSLPERV